MAEASRLKNEEHREKTGRPDTELIGVRDIPDMEANTRKNEGTIRESPEEADFWMEKYPGDIALILY